MTLPLRVGILGAGLGSRLQSRAAAKPLAALGTSSLLGLLLERFRSLGVDTLHCALRGELVSPEMRAGLPGGAHYLFVNTESSLHTLVELIRHLSPRPGEQVLFSMADTVLRPRDLAAFYNFACTLGPEECAVLTTPFVDDENPLWVTVDTTSRVQKFGAEPSGLVTSGIYVLSTHAMEIAAENLARGQSKMRNFLADLAARGIVIKSFVVSKTIDVDHPSDLQKAEELLQGD